jgi:hypothetical protein
LNRAHFYKESFTMKCKRLTRRELLQTSAGLGALAAGGGALWGVAGCKKRAMGAHSWRELEVPVPAGSVSPRVAALPDSSAILSWLEPGAGRTAAFRFSTWRDARWSEPQTIASGQVFSRDQAAAPGVIGLSPQNLMAYWSQKPSGDETATNEISLFMAASKNGGAHWTPPMLVNRAAAQPGEDNAYASAAALDEQRAMFVWLDGRNWAKDKRVQLMTRTAAADGAMSEAVLLDADACTCCSTSTVQTSFGLLASYRGHTPENIRDISLVRGVSGGWSQPQIAYADLWHIEACPVNGPHVAVDAERTALIWFTAPQDQPAVKVAFSQNGGADFSPPVRVDTGNAIGRAQIVLLPENSGAAFWLEREAGAAKLMAVNVGDRNTLGAPFELLRGANLGFPHAARANGGIIVAWAERNPTSQVHAGFLQSA